MPKRKRPSTQASNGAAVDRHHHHHHQQQQQQQRQQDAKSSSNDAPTPGASRKKTSKKAKKKKNKTSSKHKKTHHPLNGLILAVTALDEKRTGDREEADDDTSQSPPASSSSSYKRIIDKCREHGATVTRQVHRRVHALIVSDAAVQNASQRVRKAIKLRIPIVDVGWIEACADGGGRVEWTEYLRDDEAREAAAQAKEAANVAAPGISDHDGCDVKFDDIGEDDASATSGWTDAVELDCCCVCHENGDLECPWCTGDKECNLTKRRLGK